MAVFILEEVDSFGEAAFECVHVYLFWLFLALHAVVFRGFVVGMRHPFRRQVTDHAEIFVLKLQAAYLLLQGVVLQLQL